MEAVACFAQELVRIEAALSGGIDASYQLVAAYCLAGDVRNMSADERWKAPCNRFRAVMSILAPGAAILAGRAMLAALPSDVEFAPLDYWPPSQSEAAS